MTVEKQSRWALANESYEGNAPDWVLNLATEADRIGTNAAARKIGYSAPVLSQVFRNTYGAKTDAVERRVRGELMGAEVTCPRLGPINILKCDRLKEEARNFSPRNSDVIAQFKACTACPRFKKEEVE